LIWYSRNLAVILERRLSSRSRTASRTPPLISSNAVWNTQLDPDKCSSSMGTYTLEHMDPHGPEAKDLIDMLPVFEAPIPGCPALRPQVLEAMTPEAREAYLYNRERPATMEPPKTDWAMPPSFHISVCFSQSTANPDPSEAAIRMSFQHSARRMRGSSPSGTSCERAGHPSEDFRAKESRCGATVRFSSGRQEGPKGPHDPRSTRSES
jgi:hypothetical protein